MSTKSAIAFGMALALPFALGWAAPARGETLTQALIDAYAYHPKLAAEAAGEDVAKAGVDEARAGRRLHADISASAGRTELGGSSAVFPFSPLSLSPLGVAVDVVQPLYAGGRLDARLAAAEAQSDAARAQRDATEAQVLLAATTAYLDVVAAEAALKLAESNEQLVIKQLHAAERSHEQGEVTATDIAQADARRAQAEARRIRTAGLLEGARANYGRAIGHDPGALELPTALPALPVDLAAAIDQALRANPQLDGARAEARAAARAVDAASGARLPAIALTAHLSDAREPDFVFEDQQVASIAVQMSVPIYHGGALTAGERSARATQRRSDLLVEDADAEVRSQVVRAWQLLQTAHATSAAIDSQIAAAQRAFDGVSAEQREGERTTLDVLDASQEMLDAQTSKVVAERDLRVAAYALRALTGGLSIAALGIGTGPGGSP